MEQLLKRSIALFEASDFRGKPYVDALRQYGAFLQRERRTEARQVLNRAKTMARALRQP